MILSPERVTFDRIANGLYLGSRIASLDDYHRLRAEGIRASVDMKHEGADPWTFEAFLWLPTVDHEPPSRAHLHLGMAFLRQCEVSRFPVIVHCMAGIGRSSALVLAHLMSGELQGASTENALEFLVSRRPVVRPTREQVQAAVDAAKSFRT
jgi:protein tyrosine phosphatase